MRQTNRGTAGQRLESRSQEHVATNRPERLRKTVAFNKLALERQSAMRVYVESDEGDLEGIIHDDADLDGTFTLTDDEGQKWSVNGWCCYVEVLS